VGRLKKRIDSAERTMSLLKQLWDRPAETEEQKLRMLKKGSESRGFANYWRKSQLDVSSVEMAYISNRNENGTHNMRRERGKAPDERGKVTPQKQKNKFQTLLLREKGNRVVSNKRGGFHFIEGKGLV